MYQNQALNLQIRTGDWESDTECNVFCIIPVPVLIQNVRFGCVLGTSLKLSMATLERIDGIETFVRQRIETERRSYEYVSKELQEAHPTVRGLSARSVRRFCVEYGIHRTSRLPDHDLDRVVASSVAKVSVITLCW